MKFAVACLIGAASATILNQSDLVAERAWFNHVDDNGLSYGTKEEYEFRMNLFMQTYEEVEAFNADPTNTHKLTTNFMSTWTAEERKKLNGYKHITGTQKNIKVLEEKYDDDVNWVTKGAVTDVKNQGQCGSCWAFSTTGSVEGAHFLAGNDLVALSEQQLVDCDHTDDGCSGGLMDYAFKYLEKNGLMTEAQYPYIAKRHSIFDRCRTKEDEMKVKVTSYSDVTPKSLTQMKAAVTKQPVSIAIEADKSAFQLYHTGVITGDKCGTHLDHGVLAVGYGTQDGEDYFLVKNSWGASWGDHGYVKIGSDNVCGMLQQPSYPETN